MIQKLLFFLFVALTPLVSFGQGMETSISKKKIAVGEPFVIKFESEVKESDELQVVVKFDSLAVLKLNDETKAKDTAYFDILKNIQPKKEKIQGKFYWIFSYEVIAFEPGTFFLPPQDFKINKKVISSDPKMIPIALVDKIKDVDIYDIEENFSELPSPFYENIKQIILWSLLVLTIIGLSLLYYFFVYKKQEKEEAVEEKPTSDSRKKIAVKELNDLMKEKLWEKDQAKEHFTQVSLITRRYLSQEMGESFMEKTSLETQLILRNKGIYERELQPLGLILNVTDMVKFAKSSLEEEGVMTVYQQTKKFIEDFNIR